MIINRKIYHITIILRHETLSREHASPSIDDGYPSVSVDVPYKYFPIKQMKLSMFLFSLTSNVIIRQRGDGETAFFMLLYVTL